MQHLSIVHDSLSYSTSGALLFETTMGKPLDLYHLVTYDYTCMCFFSAWQTCSCMHLHHFVCAQFRVRVRVRREKTTKQAN